MFLGLVVLGTIPLAAALVVLALEVGSPGWSAGFREALDDVAETGGAFIEAIDTTRIDPAAREALERHTQTIARGTIMARRAEWLIPLRAEVLAAVIAVAAAILVAVSLHLARRWSRYYSAPIEELTGWVRRIEQRQPLPDHTTGGSTPEFESLQQALRTMSEALERARHQELERERLLVFREVARRVAHEIRGPLTASRLALEQLSTGRSESAAAHAALAVLREENARLEAMAREFSEFGRLPEGPEADVDVGELLQSIVLATVPGEVPVRLSVEEGLLVHGHYEPLRRAAQNLLRNAVEVAGAEGIEIQANRTDHGVMVRIRDHGPGIAAEHRSRIFEPYFTTKKLGTGLGLAIVNQAVQVHGGNITVDDTPGGGATFTIELPASP